MTLPTLILILFIAGFGLLTLEVFLPGAILGIIGGILILTACVLTGMDSGLFAGILAFFASGILITILLLLEIKILTKTPLSKKFFLEQSGTGKANVRSSSEDLIGQKGVTQTQLTPSGKVLVNGKLLEGRSVHGVIDRGVTVEVIAVTSFSITVKAV